jgi:hypothetical protein
VTPRIYRPGERDEDAYGPAAPDESVLPVPPWEPQTDGERRAFIDWSLEMLNREAQEPELEQAMRELQADERAVVLLGDLVDEPVFRQACALMPGLTREAFRHYRHGPQEPPAKKPKKRGIKANPKVVAAVIDNARLTSLFKRHFGGLYRRPSKPSRIDILRARHGLGDWECDTVQRYLD